MSNADETRKRLWAERALARSRAAATSWDWWCRGVLIREIARRLDCTPRVVYAPLFHVEEPGEHDGRCDHGGGRSVAAAT